MNLTTVGGADDGDSQGEGEGVAAETGAGEVAAIKLVDMF